MKERKYSQAIWFLHGVRKWLKYFRNRENSRNCNLWCETIF